MTFWKNSLVCTVASMLVAPACVDQSTSPAAQPANVDLLSFDTSPETARDTGIVSLRLVDEGDQYIARGLDENSKVVLELDLAWTRGSDGTRSGYNVSMPLPDGMAATATFALDGTILETTFDRAPPSLIAAGSAVGHELSAHAHRTNGSRAPMTARCGAMIIGAIAGGFLCATVVGCAAAGAVALIAAGVCADE